MDIIKKLSILGFISILIITTFSGCMNTPGINRGTIVIPSVSALISDNPKYAMASYYESKEITINANVPQYSLPLSLSDITNFEDLDSFFILTELQKDMIENNGFVVRNFGRYNDITIPYETLKDENIPIFVTSDTLLHLYHIQFDEILKSIEEREFFDDVLDLSKALFDQSIYDYEHFTDEILKESSRRNAGFFGVALELLQNPTDDYDGSEDIKSVSYSIPSYVKDEVENEIELIEKHEGFSTSPLFIYEEDYSQYVPRGHYTQSEKLMRYFKAMMWYGRISFLMKGGEPNCRSCDFLISEEDAKIQTIQACLIATALPVLSADNINLDDLWTKIYSVTSFFVGAADDLTPYEYLDCIQRVFGSEFNVEKLADDEKLFDLKVQLALLRSPKIYGGTGKIGIYNPSGIYTVEDLYEVLDKVKGMRLMGQRFIPDSYMFQQLVFPAVDPYTGSDTPFTMGVTGGGPTRVFPRGLDVMAVLGSDRALEILENGGDTEYTNYYKQLESLRENFTNLNITEWNRNLYYSWIYTLKSLIAEPNDLTPTFMQTTAWIDKQLHTSLASWAELRHDTILYAKQSYTPEKLSAPGPGEKVVGYVEPVPEFYSHILALTKMTRTGLSDMQVLSSEETQRLESLEEILQKLLDISIVELQNEELTEDDYEFIRNFGDNLDDIVTGVNDQGKETTIVADVHTDINSNAVLEEGVGYVDLIIVAYQVPDGRIIAGAGPVFSYYEFKHPMDDRLTDEKWQEMLDGGQEPDLPDWVNSFMAE